MCMPHMALLMYVCMSLGRTELSVQLFHVSSSNSLNIDKNLIY